MEPGEVNSKEQLDALLIQVGAFHDGVLKEMHWLSHNSVSKDLRMSVENGASARVLVQMQWEKVSAIELTFFGIRRMHIFSDVMLIHSETGLEEGALKLDLDGCEFVFERMTYRDVSDWMDTPARLGAEF